MSPDSTPDATWPTLHSCRVLRAVLAWDGVDVVVNQRTLEESRASWENSANRPAKFRLSIKVGSISTNTATCGQYSRDVHEFGSVWPRSTSTLQTLPNLANVGKIWAGLERAETMSTTFGRFVAKLGRTQAPLWPMLLADFGRVQRKLFRAKLGKHLNKLGHMLANSGQTQPEVRSHPSQLWPK